MGQIFYINWFRNVRNMKMIEESFNGKVELAKDFMEIKI